MEMMSDALKKRLDELSKRANPGRYGTLTHQSGTTYLMLGEWVGQYGSEQINPMNGHGRAEIVNSNVPSSWEESRKPATAAFLAELANAYRAGLLVVVNGGNNAE
jgi:hypothetical protein